MSVLILPKILNTKRPGAYLKSWYSVSFIRSSKFGVQDEPELDFLLFFCHLSLETFLRSVFFLVTCIIFQYVTRELLYQLCGFSYVTCKI